MLANPVEATIRGGLLSVAAVRVVRAAMVARRIRARSDARVVALCIARAGQRGIEPGRTTSLESGEVQRAHESDAGVLFHALLAHAIRRLGSHLYRIVVVDRKVYALARL